MVGDATATGTTPISTVNGSRYPGTNPGPVPTQTFPQITSTTTPWTSAGYTLHTYTGATACTDAKAFLATAPSGKHVLLITGSTACTFSYSGAATTTTVNGDLAVVSDWGFSFSNQSNWNGSAGTVKKLHFISVAPAASCPPDGSTDKDIFVGQRTTFNAQLNVFFYTPCTATMENQNAFAGQVLATNVSIGNQFTMTFTPVLVPGSGEVSGFEQSISYVREV